MAIPDIPSIMLPLLELAAVNYTHRDCDAVDPLADRLGLMDEERRKLATLESAPVAG